MRTLQPNTLIDGRLGTEGDYRSHRRQRHSAGGVDRRVGNAGDDQRHLGLPHGRHQLEVARRQITFKLVDIVSKGGNYLLNVGPTAEGVIPAAEPGHPAHGRPLAQGQRRGGLRRRPSPFGDEFGEYTRAGAKDVRGQTLFLSADEWRVTTKPGKLYFTFFTEPRAPFEIPADEEPAHARLSPRGPRAG